MTCKETIIANTRNAHVVVDIIDNMAKSSPQDINIWELKLAIDFLEIFTKEVKEMEIVLLSEQDAVFISEQDEMSEPRDNEREELIQAMLKTLSAEAEDD